MKKIILSFLLSIVLVYGQSQTTTCASNINLPLIQQNNSALYQRIIALEQHTLSYINSVNNGNNTARLITPNATIIIPVVVHVLHRNEVIGFGRNISVAQIQSQIDVLNEDFRRLNADRVNTPTAFQAVAADPNFEFRLACIDPSGNPTNGITRTFAGVSQFNPLGNINPSDGLINEQATGIKFTSNGGRDAWPTNRYLNIWVCDMGGGLIGYGQFPFEYSVKPNTDGVVMLFNAFGRVGNLQVGLDRGKVCIHEIGHWLNLRHIWGDAICGNDFVDDTPQQRTFRRGCPSFPSTSDCSGNGASGDMFMNYMDYTDDRCQNIYTKGQSLRMRAVFATGGPRASFIDNYFKLNLPVQNPLCGSSTTVTAINPLCLVPISWSITGPGTVSGAGNTATVNRTGNGTITVTATVAGYTDSKIIAAGTPGNISLQANPGAFDFCNSGNMQFDASLENSSSTTTFNWSVSGSGARLKFGGGGSTPVFFINRNGSFEIIGVVTNSCGTTNYSSGLMNAADFYANYCGTFRVAISPNPVKSNMSVTIDRLSGVNDNVVFKLYTLNSAQFIKQWNMKGGQSSFNLNCNGLTPGNYLMEVTIGKNKATTQVFIE